jgi:hypothetical protein
VKGSDGEVPLSVPRDRDGSFEPELVKKGQTRIDGVDDKIMVIGQMWRCLAMKANLISPRARKKRPLS